MNISNIKLNCSQISGNEEGSGFLLNEAPGFLYENGHRTDKQTYLKEKVVFPDNAFEKITVKIPGTQSVVTAEQLAQKKGKIKVRFKNLTGKFYRTSSGEYALSCSADGMEVIS